MIGRTIGHYRVIEKVGEGGMGVVYLADDLRLRRRVALKAVRPEVAADPDRRARLEREAQAVAALSHQNIASVHAFEIDADGTCFIVLEYIAGTSLRDVLKEPVPLDRLLTIGLQIAAGLEAAHQAGIVHRDLKPENVIVSGAECVKLLDFGVARVLAEPGLETTTTRLTAPGALVGTMGYAAPEQLTGRAVDGRTDIFAFGLVLYELAAGRPAFLGSTPIATASEILTAEAAPMPADTPPELERIIRKCLRKTPDERYQSAREVAVDLRVLQRGIDGAATQPAAAPPPVKAGGRTPAAWWRVNNVFDVALLTAGLVLLSILRDRIGGATGARWYFATMAVAAAVLSLRAFLLCIAVFDPAALPREIGRVMRWLKPAETVMFGMLLVAAGLVAGTFPTLTGLLLVLTVGGFIVALFVEPLMVRAAFPQFASGTGLYGTASLRRRLALASMQTVMTLPWCAAWLRAATLFAGQPIFLIRVGEWPTAVGVTLGLTIGCWFGLSVATGMLQGRVGLLRQYLRWFPLHLLFDVVAIIFAIVAAARAFDFPAGLSPIGLAFVPIYQRRLARALLDEHVRLRPPSGGLRRDSLRTRS